MKKTLVKIFGLMTLIFMISTYQAFAETNSYWINKTPLPEARHGHDVVTLGDNIYAIGGKSAANNTLKTVDLYNPATDSWKSIASMNVARYRTIAVPFDGKIYVFGGLTDASTTYTDTVEVYNPNDNKWTVRTKMSSARSNVLAAVVNNKIYVIGGILAGGKLSGAVEAYDPVSNTWESKAALPSPRQTGGIAVVDGKIYVLGGSSGGWNTTIQMYDPTKDLWIQKNDLPFKRANFGIVSVNNKIYLLGGNDPSISPNTTDEVEIYDPKTETWETGPSLTEPRYLNASTVYQGNIYSIGGSVVGSNAGATGLNQMLASSMSEEFVLSGDAQKGVNNLKWSDLSTDNNYELKRSSKAGGPYETITVTKNTYYPDTKTEPNQTYYYIVTVTEGDGTVRKSNEISLSAIGDSSNNRALLTITLTTGLEKEYDLSMKELNEFLDWFDQKDSGIGPAKYAFNKTWNKGPFNKRTEYVVFDKILTFNIDEYTTED